MEKYEIRKVMYYEEDGEQFALSFPLSEEGKFDCYGVYENVPHDVGQSNPIYLQDWVEDFSTLEQAERFVLERMI